jgi:putative glycerol-1-phosphate prenyltransferase
MPNLSPKPSLLHSLPPAGWALLVDPDKFEKTELTRRLDLAKRYGCSAILIGSSTTKNPRAGNDLLLFLRTQTSLPCIQFPGPDNPLLLNADALLFLSLISGRNPEFLIGHQVKWAQEVAALNTEVISTGYILMDGGKETTAHRISNTTPIPSQDAELASKTALAAELLGMHLIYLDSGSGAKLPVQAAVIRAATSTVKLPVWVGGGLRKGDDIKKAWQAGANIVVIGNLGEENLTQLEDCLIHALD